MKWDDGKPRVPGKYAGTIHGVPFKVEITTTRIHSQLTHWAMRTEVYDEVLESKGRSGGVQRALSCLREDLEFSLRDNGVEA
jgi:hypothetical protein